MSRGPSLQDQDCGPGRRPGRYVFFNHTDLEVLTGLANTMADRGYAARRWHSVPAPTAVGPVPEIVHIVLMELEGRG